MQCFMSLAVILALVAGATAAAPSCGSALGSLVGKLPAAERNGYCGAGIAVCPEDQCCDQYGLCSSASCISTCQCELSGKNSTSICPGNAALSDVKVPIAEPGAICGPGVAKCPAGQCCSQYGFCGTDIHCDLGCLADHGGEGSSCKVNSNPQIVRYNLTIDWRMLAPDGYTRPVASINGGAEGPTLYCNVGDRIIVTLDNNLDQPVSLHWHGILQRGTNIMDGVAGVTQRAIRGTQIYDFICVLPGSYWYHSHFKTQYIDGVRGALVVNDPTAPQPPVDAVITVTDWYRLKSDDLAATYFNKSANGFDPIPISALLNGVGQGNCRGPSCNYAVVPAVAGDCSERKTYVRIVSMSGLTSFTVSIDDHFLQVVAVDGVPVAPSRPLKAVRLNVAQRLDVVVCRSHDVNGPNATEPAWIRATIQKESVSQTGENRRPQEPLVLGVLQYGPVTDKPRKLPVTTAETTAPYLLFDGNPLINYEISENPYDFTPISGATPPPSNYNFTLNIDFYNESRFGDAVYPHFNNIAFAQPGDGGPITPSIIEGLAAGEAPPPNKNFGTHIQTVPAGAVVDIIVNNPQPFEHPLHLHGHWFWVMWRGLPNTGNFYPAENQLDTSPFLRDTATINQNSSIVLRFVANNPGAWIFHCHIDWHLQGGLAIVIRYGIGADAPVSPSITPPPSPPMVAPGCTPGPVRNLKGVALNTTAIRLSWILPNGSCDSDPCAKDFCRLDSYMVDIFDLTPSAAQVGSTEPPLIFRYTVELDTLPVDFNLFTPGHLYRCEAKAVGSDPDYNMGPIQTVNVTMPASMSAQMGRR